MKNKGLTVIEIIITIAILGIVALLFVQIFSVSFTHIINAGKDSKELIQDQMGIETTIDTDGPGAALVIDMNTIFPTIYTAGSQSVEGVTVLDGAFLSYLPGVKDYIIYVTNLILSDTNITLTGINEVMNVTTTVVPNNASNQDVEWLSDNPSVVTVVNGLITAVSEGTTTVHATALGSDPLNSNITVDVAVTVSLPSGSDATLSDIKLDGVTISGFNPGIYAYADEVNGNNPPIVTYEKTDVNATVSYDPATDSRPSEGDNVAYITVTSADGSNVIIYTITFTKK
ncbi:MAG: Ig-like domain-containing protein [Clostridia bacterium]|nr:Ig-like domain-containing protein [Clostridia bacterium]